MLNNCERREITIGWEPVISFNGYIIKLDPNNRSHVVDIKRFEIKREL